MDVMLFGRVLWRYKWLTLAGVLLGLVLAVLSYGRPGFSHGKPTIIPHGAEVWQSQGELLITQQSFPYGRATQQYTNGSLNQGGTPPQPIGGVGYMSSLAPIYAALANGDAIQAQVVSARVPGSVTATDVSDPSSGSLLPLVQLTATAPSSTDARLLALRATHLLQSYVARQQAAAGVAPSQAVELSILARGSKTQLVQGHKLTAPLLVFMAVLIAAVSLVFILENARQHAAGAPGLFDRVQPDAEGPVNGANGRVTTPGRAAATNGNPKGKPTGTTSVRAAATNGNPKGKPTGTGAPKQSSRARRTNPGGSRLAP
jgi:hypothetical protein